MNKVYLLIGGNMGDRMANIKMAQDYLDQEAGKLMQRSAVYETEAWGFKDQPAFLNQAILLHTHLDASTLMETLLSIELKMGRKRAVPMGPRTIDLDIIYFNEEIIDHNLLTIPHPRLAERRFVLLPISEIAPNYIHPVFQKNNATLLKECGDSLAVYKKTEL
jgi:2-amino-4-hydroxy-6-hydroxymethyldihydropteridine diphosphokinase